MLDGKSDIDCAPLPDVKSWAVAWTKVRCEKVLSDYLTAREVPHFLPLLSHRRVYGKRIRHSHLPLFSGYVFFDSDSISNSDIYDSRKVAQVLVPDEQQTLKSELSNLALALQHDDTLRETRFGAPGRPVYVARGPLKGVYGEFVRYGTNSRLIVKVGFISKAAELAIDEAFIEPVL